MRVIELIVIRNVSGEGIEIGGKTKRSRKRKNLEGKANYRRKVLEETGRGEKLEGLLRRSSGEKRSDVGSEDGGIVEVSGKRKRKGGEYDSTEYEEDIVWLRRRKMYS